ncbi:MAG TPA: pentapeptide repeat-containing protein [Chitinophagaceae bacterium]|nr:pentapeptide repeat-containing protein [Chitinophagaceae bacterium]
MGEYEGCTFNNCNFYISSIAGCLFIDCSFNSCDLSMVKLSETLLRDIHFKNCKMLGLLFDSCNQFGLSVGFENCTLNHSSFYKTNIKKTVFNNTVLQEVDFTGSNLTGAVFNNCNLLNARFENTILEKVDFRTSFNYTIDPELNKIKKAKFSLSGLPGLLNKYDIDIDYRG